jgi:hypothetical protein
MLGPTFRDRYTHSSDNLDTMISWGSGYSNLTRTTWVALAAGYTKPDARDVYRFAEFDKS